MNNSQPETIDTGPQDTRHNRTPVPTKEPRWPAALTLVTLGALYAAIPQSLLIVPHRWSLLIAVGILLPPTIISHRRGNHLLNEILGITLNSLVTLAMIWALGLLIATLLREVMKGGDLLRAAGALWIGNILVFASWYWRLDAGGPRQRDLMTYHTDGAFLFPQMTMSPELKVAAGEALWSPNFVDYLFLAFNTSTAFSPTDTPPLSRWAKILMIVQSLISLLILALLASSAVNILAAGHN